jgi:hypothetical protein
MSIFSIYVIDLLQVTERRSQTLGNRSCDPDSGFRVLTEQFGCGADYVNNECFGCERCAQKTAAGS